MHPEARLAVFGRTRGRAQTRQIALRLCAIALDQVLQNGAGLGNGLIAIGDDR